VLARRLLLAALGGGTFDVGYVMSADEVAFWQDHAALLDPDAYEWVNGNSQSRTVGAGEHWYLLNAWNVEATGGGTTWFHRPMGIDHALPLSEGTVITTRSAGGGMYLCKPSLVTGSDARYTDDPRALYFDRMQRIGELTQYFIGATNTGSSASSVAFPGDFTNGLIIHVSSHDVAWTITRDAATVGGATNTLNEISDSNRMRFAETVIVPFKRTVLDAIMIQGVSETEGRATVHFLKLPGDW
jgi:hypothetical protein